MSEHDNATASLYGLTKAFPALLRQLGKIPAHELPEPLQAAREGFVDAILQLGLETTRARMPARERMSAMGRRLAEIEDFPACTQERKALEGERMRLNCETLVGDLPDDLRKAFDEGYSIAKAEGGD